MMFAFSEDDVKRAVEAMMTADHVGTDVFGSLQELGSKSTIIFKGLVPIGAITGNPKVRPSLKLLRTLFVSQKGSREYRQLKELSDRTEEVWRSVGNRTRPATVDIGTKKLMMEYFSVS